MRTFCYLILLTLPSELIVTTMILLIILISINFYRQIMITCDTTVFDLLLYHLLKIKSYSICTVLSITKVLHSTTASNTVLTMNLCITRPTLPNIKASPRTPIADSYPLVEDELSAMDLTHHLYHPDSDHRKHS